jgi:hypothetical protein
LASSRRKISFTDVVAQILYDKSSRGWLGDILEIGGDSWLAFCTVLAKTSDDEEEIVAMNETGEMFVSVNREKKSLTCCIPGSLVIRDHLQNAQVWPVSAQELGPDVRVHAGFLAKSREMYPILKDALDNELRRDASKWTVTLCGHSRGGAVAQIFERRLRADNAISERIEACKLCLIAAPQPIWTGAKTGEAIALVHELDVTDVVLQPFGYPPLDAKTLIVTTDSQLIWQSTGRAFWQVAPNANLLFHPTSQIMSTFTRALGANRVGELLKRRPK